MVRSRSSGWVVLGAVLFLATAASAQQAGSIRGFVRDKDFDAPLGLVDVLIVETGQKVTGTEQGNYVIGQVPPGQYTLVFLKEGYARFVKSDVVVTAGQLTEVDAELSGEFTEMEEFVVQDLRIGGATEVGLLNLRLESPALMDSIGSDLMSRAGASDAAAALRLVAGATVEGGRRAVIRGLPDRYVSSQLNSVRLPSADEDTRAVDLDQFPAAVIESIQVSKTFTPDQQGDASGGAVNVRLKTIPDDTIFQFKIERKWNSQVPADDFLTYKGGGVSTWANDTGGRDVQPVGQSWDGAVGVSDGRPSQPFKWSLATGGNRDVGDGVKIGGFGSFFYERDVGYFDNGIENSYWVIHPHGGIVPETFQGVPSPGGDWKTALYDITQGTDAVQWGGLATAGFETENNLMGVTYLYTRTAEDVATLAEDTRGKYHYFPDYDPTDPQSDGAEVVDRFGAPFLRTETLAYTERTIRSLQLNGRHTFPVRDFGFDGFLMFAEPELDWVYSQNEATLCQPDKRQFGTLWTGPAYDPGIPFLGIPPSIADPTHWPYKPAQVFTLGNLQRIWKDIEEDDTQWTVNLALPFKQWTDDEGYLKFGWFDDRVDRTFGQQSYSNFNDVAANDGYVGDWDEFWSTVWPSQHHAITAAKTDVDYDGHQAITAWYVMADVPLFSSLSLIGGVRWESTDISTVNHPEADALWFPPGDNAPRKLALTPGAADVDFSQDNALPSIGLVYTPFEALTLRASYSETVARQTFKELTPVQQQEFLGGPVFVGNPDLKMSGLKNYDLRLDYAPYTGGLISASFFYKDITDAIEYVQRVSGFTYTTAENYPTGRLKGLELELRQDLGRFWEPLDGLTVGANATFIRSEVTLPEDEQAQFEMPNVAVPMQTRDMTGAPEHLYNVFLTYDLAATGTQVGLFYTVKGDTLEAGAGTSDGNFVPSVYALQYDSLNLTVTQNLGDYFKFTFKAKNLTNPYYQTVYRDASIGGDVLKSSFTSGIEYTLGLSAQFTF